MLISENEIVDKLGIEIQKEYAKQKAFVDDPSSLARHVEAMVRDRQILWAKNGQVPEPRPNDFAYLQTYAKGLVKYSKRLQNFVLARTEEFSEVRKSQPVRLDIEPASRCNFACIMCQVSDWPGGKRAENLKLEHLKAIVEDQHGLCEVKLQGFGEPLMNKELFDMAQYLVEKDIWVRTTVNGSLLAPRENYVKLIDSGVGDITGSFDGANKEVFESIRRKSNFETVVDGFQKLNHYANAKKILATRMWVVVQQANRLQYKEFVELANKMEFRRLTFSVGLSDWGQDKWKDNNSKLQTNEFSEEELLEIADLGKKFGMEITFWNLKSKFSFKNKRLCHWPFQWSFIGSDSKVTACCMIGDPRVLDLTENETKFSESWNGQKYIDFRRAHLAGNIPQPCENCYED